MVQLQGKVVRPVSFLSSDMVRTRIVALQELVSRISNLLDHPTVQAMRIFQAMLRKVRSSVMRHEKAFRAETGKLITSIRAGKNRKTEEHIRQRCSDDHIEVGNVPSGKYSLEYLAAWLNVKEQEANILQEYLSCAESMEVDVNCLVHKNCTVLALVVQLYTARGHFLGTYCTETEEHTTLPRFEDSPLSRECDIFFKRKETFKQAMSAVRKQGKKTEGLVKFVVNERELRGENAVPGIALKVCEDGTNAKVQDANILLYPVRNLQVRNRYSRS